MNSPALPTYAPGDRVEGHFPDQDILTGSVVDVVKGIVSIQWKGYPYPLDYTSWQLMFLKKVDDSTVPS